MENPEYIIIVRQRLAAWRAAAQAQADAAPSPATDRSFGAGSEQNEQNEQITPAQAGSGPAPFEACEQIASKLRANSPAPAADVAGEMGQPAADAAALPVAPASLPARAGTGPVAPASLPAREGTGLVPSASVPAREGTGVPANWQEIDPRAYQPRPFGPMETDPDWPGSPDDAGDYPPPPAAPDDLPDTAPLPMPAGVSIRQVDSRGGLAIAPAAGQALPDLEDVCWLCEDEAEFYDPSGQAWCSLCLEVSGKTMGWQDLVDLLPAAWQRREESHQQLAVYAAAHYHQAGRPRVALRWSQPPFHQTLAGADLFRAFAERLASPHRWLAREAERLMERLVEHQGLGV